MHILMIPWNDLIFVLLLLALVLLIFYLIYRLALFCFAKVSEVMKDHGINKLASFLALGISATFFYDTFSALVRNTGSFFSDVIREFSAFLPASGSSDTSDRVMPTLLDSFAGNILTLPFISILLFCVVWVFVAIILQSFMKSNKDAASPQVAGVFQADRWKYTVFGILILFGIFLSIASIIAVPVFEEDQSQKDLKAGLQIGPELNNYVPDSTFFGHKYVIRLDSSEINNSTKFAASVIENWNDRVSSSYLTILQNKERAIGRFNIAKEEKLTEDAKIDYMQELIEWFLASKAVIISNLNEDKPVVNSFFNEVYWSSGVSGTDTTGTRKISDASYQKSFGLKAGEDLPLLPPVPSVSSSYGIFGWMAGWILSTNNLAFALIVGMVGFGVFGATISHIILETTETENQTTFTSVDYLKLLIRGFSAAIVIYLAAKGGLLIISGETADLNAYIIFFLCFVAAVFSEVIWNWVKEKLQNSLKNS